MQRNCEESLKCLQVKGFPCNLQCNATSLEELAELKSEPGTHPTGDVTEPGHLLGSEFLQPSNEIYSKLTYHHDYNA